MVVNDGDLYSQKDVCSKLRGWGLEICAQAAGVLSVKGD